MRSYLSLWIACLLLGVEAWGFGLYGTNQSASTPDTAEKGGQTPPQFSAQITSEVSCRVLPQTSARTRGRSIDLDETYPGAPEQIIPPNDPRAAEVSFNGNLGSTVNVLMPNSIHLHLGGSNREDSTIWIKDLVTDLNSNQANFDPESITTRIGGTRQAIPEGQQPGVYRGKLEFELVHP